MSTPLATVNVEEHEISGNLNSSMLFNFLMGIYTIVYAGTMYLYLSRKPANINRRIILTTITMLYLLCFSNFIYQWYFINWSVVTSGDTRNSIFLATVAGGPSIPMETLNNFLFYSMFIVSDGLLIWRCYHVWGQSIRVLSILLVFFIAEFGLFVTVTTLAGLTSQTTSDAQANLYNNFLSALSFMSLRTTAITTFLIGYRVYSASRLNGPPSGKLFNRVVVLVIESSAVYSLALLVNAILVVIPSSLGTALSDAPYYVEVVLSFVAGMAPTVLVARTALTDPGATFPSTTTHISGLEFMSSPGGGGSGTAFSAKDNHSNHTSDEKLAPVAVVKRESVADGVSWGSQV